MEKTMYKTINSFGTSLTIGDCLNSARIPFHTYFVNHLKIAFVISEENLIKAKEIYPYCKWEKINPGEV